MPPGFDPDDLEAIDEVLDNETRRTYSPPKSQKIGWYTVAFLILNRTIGSGIFVTSAQVLRNTQSAGLSLIFWAIGGLLTLCVASVWLQFGLSTPRWKVAGGVEQCVPRSGGEKNYLEFALRKPKFLATCIYGIPFILLGNLTGNALALGRYLMLAAGYSDAAGNLTASKGSVIGIAIGALSIVILVHISSRRGGIVLNDLFAVFKVLLLIAVIVLGFVFRGGALPQGEKSHLGGQNFALKQSFADRASAVSSYTQSLLYVVYAYSGYEQPFYILSEVYRPKRYFAKTVIGTTLFTICLFLLVNIAYLCVVPMDVILESTNSDMATLFFSTVFKNSKVTRAMQGIVALSILGNIVVMTFTASRVKQEIAKEGILPWSLFFATGRTTPLSRLKARFRRRGQISQIETGGESPSPLEQSPMAALGLHWLSSLVLLAVTAKLSVDAQYAFLISLYSYVMVVLVAFCTTTGLLYCKYLRKDWEGEFKLWGGATAAITYWIAALFVLVTTFLKPSIAPLYPYYLVPSIGLSALLWGVIWYGGLQIYMRWKGLQLTVTREPYIEQEEENGEWVMKYETVRHVWLARRHAVSGSVFGTMED